MKTQFFSEQNSLKIKQKRVKTAEKKKFDQLLGARSTQKLVKIHNNGSSLVFRFHLTILSLRDTTRATKAFIIFIKPSNLNYGSA